MKKLVLLTSYGAVRPILYIHSTIEAGSYLFDLVLSDFMIIRIVIFPCRWHDYSRVGRSVFGSYVYIPTFFTKILQTIPLNEGNKSFGIFG